MVDVSVGIVYNLEMKNMFSEIDGKRSEIRAMLTEERQKRILEILARKGSVTVSELMAGFEASESTIRRDLNAMAKDRKLVKVHGGAMANPGSYETQDEEVELRKSLNVEGKLAIAKYAASLIKDDDFVYLDAGTTTELVIDFLESSGTVFVTNAIDHAKKLAMKGYKTLLLGGELKPTTEAVVGEEAVGLCEKYNFTKGFFGVNGITDRNGCTTPEFQEAMVKKSALESSKDVFILADHSKFGQVAAITFAPADGGKIITDQKPDEQYMKNMYIIVCNR